METPEKILILALVSGMACGILFMSDKPKNINTGQITHKSCAGETLNIYTACHNIKADGMMLTWETPDRTDGISRISILKSGLIEIKFKLKEN